MRIAAQKLTRAYASGSTRILAVNSVDFMSGESGFVAIVGKSGSGKSTLLNLVGLNDYPTSGRLLIDEKDTAELSGSQRRSLRLRRMGFVFQNFNLLPTLSAKENVELPMSLAGCPADQQNTKAMRLLENVDLTDRIYHRPKQLSMGEQQRVAIARALANDPELIIADEPTGELDSKTAEEIMVLLMHVAREERRLIITATHDEKIAEKADTVYRLEDGRFSIQKAGTKSA